MLETGGVLKGLAIVPRRLWIRRRHFSEVTQYTDKFTVTSLDSNRITISYHWSESWTETATGNWEKNNDGNDAGTSEYMIDLASLNVVNGTKGAED